MHFSVLLALYLYVLYSYQVSSHADWTPVLKRV